MRLLLDTCVIIDWLTDADPFERNVWDILNDPGTKLYVSAETARELIVSFNNKGDGPSRPQRPRYYCTCHH